VHLSNYGTRVLIYQTTKNLPLHRTTEDVYLSTELQNMCTYLPNYRKCVYNALRVYLYIELRNACIYLPKYRTRVTMYRTKEHVYIPTKLQNTCTYLPNYRTSVPIYRTTSYVYLPTELQTKYNYTSNYTTTQQSLYSNLFMHTNHDEQQ